MIFYTEVDLVFFIDDADTDLLDVPFDAIFGIISIFAFREAGVQTLGRPKLGLKEFRLFC